MLTLLIISMLTLAFNIQTVRAEPKTWYVDDDGPADFHTIQEAISSPEVKDGDTVFVKTGTYFEKVIVNKSVLLIGEDNDTTIIDGRGPLGPGVNVTSDKVTISGFTIQYCGDWYADSGLLLYHCNDTLVAGNIIKNNVYSGIGLAASSDNNITNNIITDNPYFGVLLAESGNNNISDNVVSKNAHGVYFAGSGNNFLRDNHMQDNYYNFGVLGISLVDFIQDIDDSNTVEGKPICYFVNRHDERIPPDSGYVAIVNSTNMVVRDLELTKNDNGLLLANTNSSIVENVTVTGNYGGIELWKSDGNSISNSIASNNQAGIRMETSHSTAVSRNLISNNNQFGISIVSGSTSNIISENTISNNLGYGIFIIESEGNTLYHNNLVNDYAYVSTGYTNTWDDGYPSGGNYWSDYEERYPDAIELDGSGIWDTPYVINENNQDNYPLMERWSPRPPIPTTTDELKTEIEELGSEGEIDNQGIVRSLIAKLDTAQKLVDKEKIDEAVMVLEDFITQVQELSEIHITVEAADILIQSAEYIMSHL